jgi:undecaprenyl diphosphate synthase
LTEILQNIPKHVAIIMDGNARWAKIKNLPKIAGHKKGADNVEIIVEKAKSLGIKYLTLYTFSTENWKRPKDEVDYLMNLLNEYLQNKFIQKMIKNNVKLNFIGDIENIEKKGNNIKKSIKKAIDLTKNNSDFNLNIAINYGGRDEIIRAINKILISDIKNIDENNFKNYLDTKNFPDPELLIRTGGKKRISNFLLWQIAYTEVYITDIFWPDFDEIEFEKAINFYQNETRNFGGRIE